MFFFKGGYLSSTWGGHRGGLACGRKGGQGGVGLKYRL